MRKLFTFCSLGLVATAGAQDTIPDRWEENYRTSIAFWEDKGQITDFAGDPIPQKWRERPLS